jgi:hypothetical protein
MRELLEVTLGERVELVVSCARERHAHDASAASPVALDQPVADCAIDQADRTVVSQHEVVGDFSDRRPGGVHVPSDREQQLMFGGRQARGLCLVVAPSDEPTQAGTKLEKMLEVGLFEGHIARRYRTRGMLNRRRSASRVACVTSQGGALLVAEEERHERSAAVAEELDAVASDPVAQLA